MPFFLAIFSPGGAPVVEETFELTLLFDYYGDLLTQKQRVCFDLYYNQDFSLAEIAQEVGISRQGVHDSLTRAETALRNMEAKTGCVARERKMEHALSVICDAAQQLQKQPEAAALAQTILSIADSLKEDEHGI